ncbi:MAG TPA: hypothetical protein VNE21_07045, partial [Mycobacteriales bacterium]|nr:hypothetical protein [Mycobacteriales bacterium]
AAPASAAPASAAPAPAAITGHYTDAGYGDLHISSSGSLLSVRIGDVALTTSQRPDGSWTLHYPDLDVEVELELRTDGTGRVTDVVLALDAQTPPIRFQRHTQAAHP